MGDSDDEHDRGRRDKFRRERSDYGSGEKSRSSRSDSYRDRRPTSWREERRRSRDEYEDDSRRRYGRGPGAGGRDYSPPSAKRARKDWDSLRDYPTPPGMMTPYGLRPPPWPLGPPGPPPFPMVPGIPRESPNSAPQRHVMLSFKQFLAQQEDSIDEVAAIASYNEYKAEFKRKQVEEFFEKHKDEDWFISLYHPTNLAQNKKEAASFIQSRLDAFLFLAGLGKLDRFSLSVRDTDEIVNAMDTAVIKMEGGTEHDLLALEEEEEEEDEDKEGTSTAKGDPPTFSRELSEEHLELAAKAKQYKREKDASEGSGSNSSSFAEGKEQQEGMEDMDQTPPRDVLVRIKQEKTEDQGTAQNGGHATPPRPRPLHLTRSVYIRHIPPRLSTDDIAKVCKTLPGFLRIAFAEATADKGYERRGWVTYTHSTDIKETSNQLGSLKVKDCTLSCSVNRELSRRVKQTTAATWTRRAVHSDLQLALKLTRFLDEKHQLWEHAVEEDQRQTNPVLEFDQALLSEDAVPMAVGEEEESAVTSLEVLDESNGSLKLLERLLWYLRVVHSVDYYNGMTFPSEDKMPHRLGIFTVRPKAPLSITADDLSKYCEEIQSKIEPLMVEKQALSDADMEKYGQKDPESEVERFIDLNTQKLTESKYLCPLSGKKFKGPEFVKKHIFNKHMDKVDAVRKEAEFFNNYLRDPARPMPLEASIKGSLMPPNPKTPSADDSPSLGMVSPLGGGPSASAAWGQEAQMAHIFGRGGFPRTPFPGVERQVRARGGRRGRRRPIEYTDLDAPDANEVY